MLRQDSFMLEVCKFRLHDLLTDGRSIDEVREEAVKYLDLAKEHTPRSDWADNLFIGTVYFALGEKGKGLSCVRINEDFAGEKQISPIVIRQMEAGALDAAELSEELKGILDTGKVIPLVLLAKISADTEIAERVETSRKGVMSLYESEWKGKGLDDTLTSTVNAEFEESTKGLKWWKFQFTVKPSDVQENIAAKFSQGYEEFLKSFQSKYYNALQMDLRKTGASDFVDVQKQGKGDSWWRSILRHVFPDTESNTNWWLTVLTAAWVCMISSLLAGLAGSAARILFKRVEGNPEQERAYGDSIKAIGPTVGIIVLIDIVAASAYLWWFSSLGLVTSFALVLGTNVLVWGLSAGLSPFVPVIMIAAAVVLGLVMSSLNVGFDTARSEMIRQSLLEMNQARYTAELPASFWSEIEPYIKKTISGD